MGRGTYFSPSFDMDNSNGQETIEPSRVSVLLGGRQVEPSTAAHYFTLFTLWELLLCDPDLLFDRNFICSQTHCLMIPLR